APRPRIPVQRTRIFDAASSIDAPIRVNGGHHVKVLIFGAHWHGRSRGSTRRSPRPRHPARSLRRSQRHWPAARKATVPEDFLDYSTLESQLTGFDACFYCLGVSSAGMTGESHSRLTHNITMAAAHTLVRLNPAMTFIFVSGTGTDSTERGRSMWAGIKGKTEKALLCLLFRAAYMFRPGVIQPLAHESRCRVQRCSIIRAWTSFCSTSSAHSSSPLRCSSSPREFAGPSQDSVSAPPPVKSKPRTKPTCTVC